MKKFLVEDIKVGVSSGGMACGPVGGHVVAEIRIRNTENDTVTWHSLAEVEGTLNFTETSVSTFDIQINENYDDEEAWQIVTDGEAGGYSDYYEFYDDLASQGCDPEHSLIWKYLAFLVRAGWDETDKAKAEDTGKYLEDIEIPVCDAEQDYLDAQDEDDILPDNSLEQDLLEDIRAEYIGCQIGSDKLRDSDFESPAGDYSFEETIQDENHHQYRCTGGYTVDDNGIIIGIKRMICQKMDQDDDRAIDNSVLEQAYVLLRDILDGIM